MSQRIEVINEEPLGCGEGPLWDVANQQLYWTDAYGQAIWQYDRASEKSRQISHKRQAGSCWPRPMDLSIGRATTRCAS